MLHKHNLHKYQNTAKKHILDNDFCALFLQMGLGKTATTLTAINTLIFEELEIDTVLVVAPKRVAETVWSDEINNWSHLGNLKVSKIIGNPKQRRAALKKKAHIYLLGRDNVSWLCGLYGGSMLPFDMLVIDELSSFKNPKSVRFKALKKVQPSFSRVVGLTGTPSPNGLIDLWSQIYLLDRGQRLEKFISTYREKYFTKGASNGHIVYNYRLQKGSEEEIHSRISDICISMSAEDYLSLPKFIERDIVLKMPSEIREKYDAFEKEQVMDLYGEPNSEGDMEFEITALNAAALSNKLLQFANGAVYDASKNWHEVHSLKIEAVKEIVDTANSPVLIGWTYRHDLYRLKEALSKYEFRELKTDQDIKDWNAGKIDVLAMHPASGGHGLNLQTGGNNVVWFGQTWSLELYQQFNARLYRQGQTKPVIMHKLIAEGTMDEDVVAAQKRKATKQQGVMDAVKARVQKYFA